MSQEMKKNNKSAKLGLATLIALGTGQAIGSGVITATGLAIGATGQSTWIAFALAVIIGFFFVMPVFFFSSVVRFRGGQYTLVATLMGDRWGGLFSLGSLAGCISGGLIGKAIGSYVNSVFPFIDINVAAIVAVTLIYLFNMFGVNIMAKVQNYLSGMLIICLGAFCLIGLTHLRPDAFQITAPNYFMGGSMGLFSAIVMLMYSTTGHSLCAAFSINAKNAKRDIPLMLLLTSVILLVAYTLIGLVASNVLPVEVVAGQPLTFVAKELFPGALFYAFIFGGPIMALVTTLNSGFPALCAPVLGGIRDGWLPKSLGKTNRYGAPYIIYTAMYLISVIPILLNFSLTVLTNNTVLINYTTKILVMVAAFNLPKKFGEHWKASRFYVNNAVYYLLSALGLIFQVGVILISGSALSLPLLLVNIAVFAFLIIYTHFRYKSGKVTVGKVGENYSFDENLEE